jgi:hypothetical protein
MDRTEGRINSDMASASAIASPSPEREMRNTTYVARQHMARRAVGVVSDEPTTVPQTLRVGGLDTVPSMRAEALVSAWWTGSSPSI